MIASEKIKQEVVPRRRESVPRTKRISRSIDWARVRARAWLMARVGMWLLGLALLALVYREMTSSRSFQLRTIEVSGNYRVSSAEVERLVRQNLSATLFGTSLSKLQEQLQTVTWIKRAQVTRILPDILRIQIEERRPLVLARFESQELVWIDEEAVVLGEYDNGLDKDVPPIVFGFTHEPSEAAQAENRERIELYKRLVWALDSGPVKYSQQVEEIDLSNLKDVRLQLAPKSVHGPVEVELGSRDFRARLMLALDVLDALRRHDEAALKNYQILDEQILKNPDRISFISVVHPTQVAIRLSKVPIAQNRAQTETVARAGLEE